MISFAVCLYRPKVFERVCLPALEHQAREYGAEILTDSDPDGICHAYERMRLKAKHETVVYLHDDLELLDLDATEQIVAIMDEAGASLMGVVGSRPGGRNQIPWWNNDTLVGCWTWVTRDGKRRWQKIHPPDSPSHDTSDAEDWKGQRAPYGRWHEALCLDGLILCDRSGLPWDDFDGWHAYDVDRCMTVADAGGKVIVGDLAVCHHNQEHTREWSESLPPLMQRMREKWPVLTC